MRLCISKSGLPTITDNRALKYNSFSLLEIPICRNMLSSVEFFAVSIGSALVAYTFASWTSGFTWGFVIVAAFLRLIREWETEDEGYVIEYVEDPEDANDGVVANTYQRMPVNDINLPKQRTYWGMQKRFIKSLITIDLK